MPAGATIAVRGGTYALAANVQISKSGTASAPIALTDYQNEMADRLPEGEGDGPRDVRGAGAATDRDLPDAARRRGAALHPGRRGLDHPDRRPGCDPSYWKLVGFEIEHGPYAVYRDGGDTFERLVTHDTYQTGFQLQGASAGNLILDLDSHDDRDPRKNGDGLGIKEGSGTGNVVRGARLWNNVDDGFDAWSFTSPIASSSTAARPRS